MVSSKDFLTLMCHVKIQPGATVCWPASSTTDLPLTTKQSAILAYWCRSKIVNLKNLWFSQLGLPPLLFDQLHTWTEGQKLAECSCIEGCAAIWSHILWKRNTCNLVSADWMWWMWFASGSFFYHYGDFWSNKVAPMNAWLLEKGDTGES